MVWCLRLVVLVVLVVVSLQLVYFINASENDGGTAEKMFSSPLDLLDGLPDLTEGLPIPMLMEIPHIKPLAVSSWLPDSKTTAGASTTKEGNASGVAYTTPSGKTVVQSEGTVIDSSVESSSSTTSTIKVNEMESPILDKSLLQWPGPVNSSEVILSVNIVPVPSEPLTMVSLPKSKLKRKNDGWYVIAMAPGLGPGFMSSGNLIRLSVGGMVVTNLHCPVHHLNEAFPPRGKTKWSAEFTSSEGGLYHYHGEPLRLIGNYLIAPSLAMPVTFSTSTSTMALHGDVNSVKQLGPISLNQLYPPQQAIRQPNLSSLKVSIHHLQAEMQRMLVIELDPAIRFWHPHSQDKQVEDHDGVYGMLEVFAMRGEEDINALKQPQKRVKLHLGGSTFPQRLVCSITEVRLLLSPSNRLPSAARTRRRLRSLQIGGHTKTGDVEALKGVEVPPKKMDTRPKPRQRAKNEPIWLDVIVKYFLGPGDRPIVNQDGKEVMALTTLQTSAEELGLTVPLLFNNGPAIFTTPRKNERGGGVRLPFYPQEIMNRLELDRLQSRHQQAAKSVGTSLKAGWTKLYRGQVNSELAYKVFKNLVRTDRVNRNTLIQKHLVCGNPDMGLTIPRGLEQLTDRLSQELSKLPSSLPIMGVLDPPDASAKTSSTSTTSTTTTTSAANGLDASISSRASAAPFGDLAARMSAIKKSERARSPLAKGLAVRWNTLAKALGVPITDEDVYLWKTSNRQDIYRNVDLRYLMPKFDVDVKADEEARHFDVFLFAPEPESIRVADISPTPDSGVPHPKGLGNRRFVRRADGQQLFRMTGGLDELPGGGKESSHTTANSVGDVQNSHFEVLHKTGSGTRIQKDSLVGELVVRQGKSGKVLYGPIDMTCPYAAVPMQTVLKDVDEDASVRESALMFEVVLRSLKHGVICDALQQPLVIKRWVFRRKKNKKLKSVVAGKTSNQTSNDTVETGDVSLETSEPSPAREGGPLLSGTVRGQLNMDKLGVCRDQMLGMRALDMDYDSFTPMTPRDLGEDDTFTCGDGSMVRQFVKETLAESLKVNVDDINFCHVKPGSTILAFDAGKEDQVSNWSDLLHDPTSPMHTFFQFDPIFPPTVSKEILLPAAHSSDTAAIGIDSAMPEVPSASTSGPSFDFTMVPFPFELPSVLNDIPASKSPKGAQEDALKEPPRVGDFRKKKEALPIWLVVVVVIASAIVVTVIVGMIVFFFALRKPVGEKPRHVIGMTMGRLVGVAGPDSFVGQNACGKKFIATGQPLKPKPSEEEWQTASGDTTVGATGEKATRALNRVVCDSVITNEYENIDLNGPITRR